jgi:HK97 family phage prohead protease
MTDTIDLTQTRAPVEFRNAVVADVDLQQRIVEVVAVPYNEETVVEYPLRSGRTVIESVLPGAFEGIDTRPNRVTVNREHDYGKTIGITRALHPSRSEGLIAELRISPGPSGDDALGLAADGALGASVGMAVRPSDQRWSENRSRRHIVRAFLDHIALVAVPAYAGAMVLAVRDADAPVEQIETPYRDAVWEYLRSFKMP